MGKDIKGLYVQFASFFENSDKIHTAHCLGEIKGMTNGQIRSKSLQIAMQSKALREAEKDLKEMLIWSGNKDVWDEMMKERVRMYKERAAEESKALQAKAKKQQGLIDNLLIFVSSVATMVPTITLIFNTLIKYAPK
jgi:cell division protein FtsL